MKRSGKNQKISASLAIKGVAWTPRPLWLRTLAIWLSCSLVTPTTLLMSTLTFSQVAAASTFQTGLTLYQKANFKGAETALQRALSKKPSPAERLNILKLLGICQYMLGNKNAAAATFKQALKQAPAMTIAANEVLDESVISFFNQQKSSGRPAVESANTRPGRSVPPTKTTYLRVKSNVSNSTVMIDGIIAGPVNSLINTDPGQVLVEVSAPGYNRRQVKANIIKNIENMLEINLTKPIPKAKPVPVTPPLTSAPNIQKNGVIPNAAASGKRAPPNNRSTAGGIYAPQPKDDLFADSVAPVAAPPPAAPGQDLTAEFDLDGTGYAARPAYPPPGYYQAPNSGSPTPYQEQPYQPQPYAPQPYQQAHQQPYYAPPPTYQPPPPNYNTYPPPGYTPPPPAAVPVYADPAGTTPGRKPATNKKGQSLSGSKNNLLISLLPFGAGQFQNRNYILGLLFAAAEGGALYFWYEKGKTADTAVLETNAYVAREKDKDMTVEERQAYDQYIAERQTYVADKRKESQMFLFGFVGLYALGVVESLINDNPPPIKKRAKKRPYNRYTNHSDDDVGPLVTAHERTTMPTWHWHLGLTPPIASLQPAAATAPSWYLPVDVPRNFEGDRQLGIGLQIRLSF